MSLPAYEAFKCYWFSIQPPNLSWTGPPALWLTDRGRLKHQTSLVQVVFGADVECEGGGGDESYIQSWPPNSRLDWYSFFFFIMMSSRHRMKKIPAPHWSRGLFWVRLCVLKHKGACLSISTGLLGANQQDTEWVSVLDCVRGERKRRWLGCSALVGGVELRTSPCSSHSRPGEDRGNEELRLKWLAMVQSWHLEGRPKASRVENIVLDKSTFPFCSPDIIKNPWISNSHPQEQQRRVLFLKWKSTYLFFNIIDTKKRWLCE